MTADDLDREIIALKKQGLTPYVEKHKTGQLRQKYYLAKITKERENQTQLFLKNIAFLNRIHKSKCNKYTVEETMGIGTDDFFEMLLQGKMSIYNYTHVVLCACFFGIPTELILFTDLEANEQTIRNEYPSLFQQSRH
jgi:hypothetical protein